MLSPSPLLALALSLSRARAPPPPCSEHHHRRRSTASPPFLDFSAPPELLREVRTVAVSFPLFLSPSGHGNCSPEFGSRTSLLTAMLQSPQRLPDPSIELAVAPSPSPAFPRPETSPGAPIPVSSGDPPPQIARHRRAAPPARAASAVVPPNRVTKPLPSRAASHQPSRRRRSRPLDPDPKDRIQSKPSQSLNIPVNPWTFCKRALGFLIINPRSAAVQK